MTALMKFLQSLVDVTPEDVIGGLFLALQLANPLGLVYAMGRGRWQDLATVLVAVAAALISVGMVVTPGYATYPSSRTPRRVAESRPLLPWSARLSTSRLESQQCCLDWPAWTRPFQHWRRVTCCWRQLTRPG